MKKMCYKCIGFFVATLLFSSILFIGCDKTTYVVKDDSEKIEQLNKITEVNSSLININTKRINVLTIQLEELIIIRGQIKDNEGDITELKIKLNTLENLYHFINDDYNTFVIQIMNDLNDLRSLIENSNFQIDDELTLLQQQLSIMNTVINDIQDNAVAELVDPCGDFPNEFDEILIKLYSGEYIGYFETNGKRFLSVLEDNKSYRTTDKQNCSFRIENGTIID